MTAAVGRFEDWYGLVRPRVLATLTVLVGDRRRAEEATDEAFVRAFARWERVREMESPIGWVVTVGQNAARRSARRIEIEHRVLRRQAHHDGLALPDSEIWSLVRKLPSRQRTVVALRYVMDMTEADIAETVGISRSAVSSALTDARRRLAAELHELENELP